MSDKMTGRSWYEQFRREMDKWDRVELDLKHGGTADFMAIDMVMEAARTAAGLEATTPVTTTATTDPEDTQAGGENVRKAKGELDNDIK